MRDLGNGMFEITNKKTGEVKQVREEELGNYGILKAATPSGQQSDFSKAFEEAGVFKTPVLGGLLKMLASPAKGAIEQVGGRAYELGKSIKGVTTSQNTLREKTNRTQ